MNKEYNFKTTNGDTVKIKVLNKTTLKPNPTCKVVYDTGEVERIDPVKGAKLEGYKVEIKINDAVSTGNIKALKLKKIIEMLYQYTDTQSIKVIDWANNPSDDQLKKLMDEHKLYPSTEGQVIMETEYMMTALYPPKHNQVFIDLNIYEGFERISNIFRSRIPKVRLLGLGESYNVQPFFYGAFNLNNGNNNPNKHKQAYCRVYIN